MGGLGAALPCPAAMEGWEGVNWSVRRDGIAAPGLWNLLGEAVAVGAASGAFQRCKWGAGEGEEGM